MAAVSAFRPSSMTAWVTCPGRARQRGHLGQRRPLQAGHGSAEAEPGGGFGEPPVKRPVTMSGDFTQVGPAGHQVVGAGTQPPRHATGDLPHQFYEGLRAGQVLLGWAALHA